ncbi:hypothetical protein [Nitrospira sp. Nam74]
MQLFANNATTTLGASLTAVATSLTVATGTGALFPSPTGGDFFLATLEVVGTSTREIVKVTARSSDTFTIVRAQEGTTALSWTTADTISLRLTKGTMELLQTAYALDGARGLRVVSNNVVQGTYNGTTYVAVTSGYYDVLGVNGTGIAGAAIGFATKPSTIAINFHGSSNGAGGSARWRYWNGAWATLTPTATLAYNQGYSQFRAASPADWTTGATGLTAGMYWLYFDAGAGGGGVTTAYRGRYSNALAVDVTADEVTASSSTGLKAVTQALGTITVSIDIAGPTANGRGQAGAFSANTYIYLWLIYNPTTATWAGVWDTSATAPTLPSGYTYKLLIGGYRIDANSVLKAWSQLGRFVNCEQSGVVDLSNGTATTSTAVTLSVPPIAIQAQMNLNPNVAGTNATAMISAEPILTYNNGKGIGAVAIMAGVTLINIGFNSTMTLKIPQTVYYKMEGDLNAAITIGTIGYTMPGNLG